MRLFGGQINVPAKSVGERQTRVELELILRIQGEVPARARRRPQARAGIVPLAGGRQAEQEVREPEAGEYAREGEGSRFWPAQGPIRVLAQVGAEFERVRAVDPGQVVKRVPQPVIRVEMRELVDIRDSSDRDGGDARYTVGIKAGRNSLNTKDTQNLLRLDTDSLGVRNVAHPETKLVKQIRAQARAVAHFIGVENEQRSVYSGAEKSAVIARRVLKSVDSEKQRVLVLNRLVEPNVDAVLGDVGRGEVAESVVVEHRSCDIRQRIDLVQIVLRSCVDTARRDHVSVERLAREWIPDRNQLTRGIAIRREIAVAHGLRRCRKKHGRVIRFAEQFQREHEKCSVAAVVQFGNVNRPGEMDTFVIIPIDGLLRSGRRIVTICVEEGIVCVEPHRAVKIVGSALGDQGNAGRRRGIGPGVHKRVLDGLERVVIDGGVVHIAAAGRAAVRHSVLVPAELRAAKPIHHHPVGLTRGVVGGRRRTGQLHQRELGAVARGADAQGGQSVHQTPFDRGVRASTLCIENRRGTGDGDGFRGGSDFEHDVQAQDSVRLDEHRLADEPLEPGRLSSGLDAVGIRWQVDQAVDSELVAYGRGGSAFAQACRRDGYVRQNGSRCVRNGSGQGPIVLLGGDHTRQTDQCRETYKRKPNPVHCASSQAA